MAAQARTLRPLERLSSPSIMLTALVAPTIQTTVSAMPNTPKSRRVDSVSQIPSMETPLRSTRPAAAN